MSNTTTANFNANTAGIQEIDSAMKAGNLTVDRAFAVVQSRINKRAAEKRHQITRVVEYRNALASVLRANSVTTVDGMDTADMPLPSYATAVKPITGLPTDPAQLAKQVFATVGAANIGAVISQLTAQVVGSSATK